MSIQLGDKIYYKTAEACRKAGISKNTYLRWVRMGTLADTQLRDRRGWRLFTQGDVEKLKAEVNRTQMKSDSRTPGSK